MVFFAGTMSVERMSLFLKLRALCFYHGKDLGLMVGSITGRGGLLLDLTMLIKMNNKINVKIHHVL